MSIDKSLKLKSGGNINRSVMSRVERITKMMEDGKYADDRSPFGLPKTRVIKVILKKKKEKVEGEGDAAPAKDAKKK